MQNEQQRTVQKTQWALGLTHEDLKMSACSDFVEHVWKPGSCKNCFNPKSSHRLQTTPDTGACGVLPNGVRTKPESLAFDDEGVNTSPFSKPTIAVKPTMINSDVSDVWADVNMNADLSQVSWGVVSGKQLLLKSGDAERICLDNFGNGGVRKPFLHNLPSDCLSCCPPSYSMVGLRSLESRVERNVSIHSLVLVGEVGKQEDRTKDKFALPHRAPCPNQSALGDRSTTNSSRSPSSPAREGAVLLSEGNCGHISGFESEGGEYCSITNCHREHPISWESCCAEGKAARCEKESHAPCGWRQRDAPETPRPSGRAVKFSEEEHRAVNVAFCIPKDHGDPLPYALRSERKKPSLHAEPAALPESTGGSRAAAFALSREDEDSPLPVEPSATGGPQTEGLGTPLQALVEPQHPRLTEPACADPIYAESTKRRKAQLKAVSGQSKAEKLAHGTVKEQADGSWRDGSWALGGEKEYQDSTGQVAAKITVMTAHNEDDHKTIFLSSPDSAVGVQWPCVSPTSHPDFRTSSPAIEPGQIFQASGSENTPRFHLAAPAKTSLSDGPAIPPKMSKNSQPGSEGNRVPPVSSHVARFGDDNSHDGAGVQLLPRSCTDAGAFGASPSPCAHVNGVSVEESGRGLAGSSCDRRQKYYTPTWTKQCRIEEEEEQEEEQERARWLCGVLERLPPPRALAVVAAALALLGTGDGERDGSGPDGDGCGAGLLLSWLLGNLERFSAFCLCLSGSLLASLAGRYPQLSRAYLDLLTGWGSHLHYDPLQGRWVKSCLEKAELSWEELRERFSCLCRGSGLLREQTQAALKLLKTRDGDFEVPGLSVWTDLLMEVEE